MSVPKGYKFSLARNAKISAANRGRTLSSEIRTKIGAANRGRRMPPRSPEYRAKMSAIKLGRKLGPSSAEHRAKLSVGHKGLLKGRIITSEWRAKISATLKGRKVSVETKAKISAALKGRKFTVQHLAKLLAANKVMRTSDSHARMSAAQKTMWSCSPERRVRHALLAAERLTRLAHPNKTELKLRDLLEKHFPGVMRMNVKDGIIIAGKIPDFVSAVPGYIIEMFGRYWHPPEDEPKRIEVFARLGYETLVIWEDELDDEPVVVERMREFLTG